MFRRTVRLFASKKAGGSTANGRDSRPKYLGQKRTPGQFVQAGEVLRRQRGTQIHAGDGVGLGRDHTLFALRAGVLGIRERLPPQLKRRELFIVE